MTPLDNKQTNNKPRDSNIERTAILVRCVKHGIAYLPKEGCPACEKEKNSTGGEKAGK